MGMAGIAGVMTRNGLQPTELPLGWLRNFAALIPLSAIHLQPYRPTI
jgi:hypothetical protein